MVDVIKESAEQAAQNNQGDFVSGLMQHIPMIIIIAIVIGLIIALIVMWLNIQKDQKKRDFPIYHAYCNALDSALGHADHKWIDCRYSFINLIWFGIPFLWREHSAKVRNKDEDVVGFYRGHAVGQDGFLYIAVYNKRKWLIIEDIYLLKCAYTPTIKVKKMGKDNLPVMEADGKTFKTEKKTLDFKSYIEFKHNKNFDIMINCFDFETQPYYLYPVYISPKGETIDLREMLGESIIEQGHYMLLSQVFEEGSQMARKGMQHNPGANYAKAIPEKSADVKE